MYNRSPQPTNRLMKQSQITKLMLGATLALLAIPVVTHTFLKEESPEVQSNIVALSWGLATGLSTVGLLRDQSPWLKGKLILERGLENAEFSAQRGMNINSAERRMDTIEAQDRIIRFEQHRRSGIMVNDMMDPGFIQFAMAPQGEVNDGRTAVSGGFNAPIALGAGTPINLLQGAVRENEFSNEQILKIYTDILSPAKRPSQNTVIAGGTGDNKSSFAQALLAAKLIAEPDTVNIIIDRKNGSGDDDGWKPCWGGAPIYPLVDTITGARVPFNCVYSASEPKVDKIFKWIWDYVCEFRHASEKPGDDGQYVDFTIEERRKDPLWSTKYDRAAPIIIWIDDATNVMGDLANDDRDAYARATDYIKKIATLGRTDNVHIILITHAVTTGENALPAAFMNATPIIVGASLSQASQLVHAKHQVDPAGRDRAYQDTQGKKRGFCSSLVGIPYIPPVNLDERLLRMFVNDHWALQAMIHSPSPRRYQPVHHEVLKRCGYKVVNGEIVKIDAAPAAPEPAEPAKATVTEEQMVVKLNSYLRGTAFTDEQLIAAVAATGFDAEDVSTTENIANLRALIALTPAELAELIQS